MSVFVGDRRALRVRNPLASPSLVRRCRNRGQQRVQEDELTTRYPRCYHLAHSPDVWPSIQRHGLLSVGGILERWEVPSDARQRFLREHRPATIPLVHPVHGPVFLRDQHPLNIKMLERALTDMTVPDWLEQLNRHVFFAPTMKRLEALHRAYANHPRLVLIVDTRALLAAHRYQMRLSPINTGAVRHINHSRGSSTLQRVSIFDAKREVAEIAVTDGVPDITQHVTRVEVWGPAGDRTVLT